MLEARLPGVNQVLPRRFVHRVEKAYPLCTDQAGLGQQRLSQRVVTRDEKLVSRIQPFQQTSVRSAARFAVDASVAISARQDEVPYAVEK